MASLVLLRQSVPAPLLRSCHVRPLIRRRVPSFTRVCASLGTRSRPSAPKWKMCCGLKWQLKMVNVLRSEMAASKMINMLRPELAADLTPKTALQITPLKPRGKRQLIAPDAKTAEQRNAVASQRHYYALVSSAPLFAHVSLYSPVCVRMPVFITAVRKNAS